MLKSNLRSALLGSGAAVAMVAAAAPASAGEIEGLKAQIDALQMKLDALETRQDAAESRGTVAPAAAVEAGDKPASWKLPGTNTSMNIGGYAKLDFLYDFGPFLGDSFAGSVPAADNSVDDNRDNTFRAHARQSRLWVRTWTPTDWGELATHIEGDFVTGDGNERVSNSTHFRLRHAYGTLGPVLAGQTWSNFMGFESNAETLDFGGPTGTVFVRQAQLRYTHVFGGSGFTGSVSLENPETTGPTAAAGGAGSAGPGLGASPPAIDHAPDLTGKLVYKHSKGVLVGRGLLRYLSVDDGGATGGVSDETLGWAFGVNGTWEFGANDAIGAEFNYGYGLGRYIIGGTRAGTSCSLGCAASTSELDANPTWGGYAWYQHRWTDTIRTNVAYGYSQNEFDTSAGTATAGAKANQSVHANVIWSPVSQVNFGFEVLYAYSDFHQAGHNDALRLQLGMQYKF